MSSVHIVRANPLDHAAGIKELFVAHERPEFPAFFDRAYPAAIESGGNSWIGCDPTGRLVLHVALFRRQFAYGDRTLVGGLIVNLLAARSHRTFIPALALMRRLIADSRAEAQLDFLYGDPSPQASALLKTVGFTPIDDLRRFMLPLADRRWHVDAAIRAYHLVAGLRAGRSRLVAVTHPARGYDAGAHERPIGEAPAMRPFRPVMLYRQRLPDFPAEADRWITFHRAGAGPAVAGVLVRGADAGVARLVSVWRSPSLPMIAIVPPLARALRHAGASRIWISTLDRSRFGDELRRAGFFRRQDRNPVVALALTDAGATALAGIAAWEITDLDCDR